MENDELRAEAMRRLRAKRDFGWNLVAYVTMNAFLVGLWAVTSPGTYFWPIWPIMGWGIGVVMHGWSVYMTPPITEADIQREIERIS